ncbi:MAG TPA: hypothetical protein VHN77_04040 [Phycisphaerales bacterium]|nr:hypothetical protein [Phycisphaerales bacterium]
MRVLHIAQPTTPTPPWFAFSRQTHHCAGEGSLLAIRSLLRESAAVAPDDAHIVALLGASHQHARSAALEVRGAARISPPLGQPHRAAPALRRLVATAGPLDAVVCWGANLRRLARRTAHASHLWLEVDMHSGDLHALDPHRGAVGPSIGSVVPDLPPLSTNAAVLRATARNQLGITESEPAIALVTDAACPASATDLLGAMAMLHVAGIRATCIMPTATNELSRAQRRVREGTYVQRVVYSDHGAAAMHAADVAVCAPGSTDALSAHVSLAWLACEAARVGTPIVAPEAWIGAWSHGAASPHLLLVSAKAGTPTDIARAIVPLMTGHRPTSISDAASTSKSLLTMLRCAVSTHAAPVG